jgi:hypothetical protein
MAIKRQAKPSAARAKAPKSIKAKPASKPAAKKAKPLPGPTEAPKAEKPVKAYKPRQAKGGLSSFADLLKKQSELETIKKQAKAELRKAYEDKVKEADGIKKQYSELFSESLETLPKARKARRASPKVPKAKPAKRGAIAPYTAAEISAFIEQKDEGIDVKKIKIAGRRVKSVQKIDQAYDKADTKDAESILDLLR